MPTQFAMTNRWIRFSKRLVLVLTPLGTKFASRTDGRGRVQL